MQDVHDWIFTFGLGSRLAHRCVRIHGTAESARAEMCKAFGSNWAFQYSANDWANIQRSLAAHGMRGEYEIPFDRAVKIFKEA